MQAFSQNIIAQHLADAYINNVCLLFEQGDDGLDGRDGEDGEQGDEVC